MSLGAGWKCGNEWGGIGIMSITDVKRGEPCKRNCGWTTRNLGGVCRRCLGPLRPADVIAAMAKIGDAAKAVREFGEAAEAAQRKTCAK